MKTNSLKRNNTVDMLRGAAMLLVILGHTVTGTAEDAFSTTVYNIIWSLQMPLFMLISGYVTKYSKKPDSFKAFLKSLGKKTVAYLLPFVVWTFLVRGIIMGEDNYRNVKYVLWHMDAGYWFLFSIWTINMVYTVASFASIKFAKEKTFASFVITGVVYALGMAALGALGIAFGLDFLCIKLTLYYMPFYFAGYFFSVFRDRVFGSIAGRRTVKAAVVLCLAVYAFIITRVNLFEISESMTGILTRAAASLFGCITVCYLLPSMIDPEGRLYKSLSWVGVHSLEIYLVHYLFLSLIRPDTLPALMTPEGVLLCGGNFIFTLFLSVVAVKALNVGDLLPAILFGKTKKKNK